MILENHLERERKFILTPESYRALQTVRSLGGYFLGEAGTFRRDYIYFDREEGLFRNNGTTLSIRVRPPKCALTAKIPTREKQIEERVEHECIIDESISFYLGMDLPRSKRIDPKALSSFLKTDVHQLRGKLLLEVINSRIPIFKSITPENIRYDLLELSLAQYRGTINGTDYQTLYEAEIEIEEGTAKDLESFCTEFKKQYLLEEIFQNKYQRMRKALEIIK